MSERWPGGIVRSTPVTPTGPYENGAAPGIWTMEQAAYWTKQGLWPTAGNDQYFNYTTLLMSTTAINGAQNNTFLDSSTNNFTITRNGNTTQGSFTPYWSYWSNYFDGSGDYLTVSSNAAFGMGTGDFTIECWVNPAAFTGSGNVLIDMRSGTEPSVRPDLEYNSSGVLNYRVNGSTVISGGTLVIGTWSHVALARSGTTTKLFLNGVQVGSSYSDSNNYGSSAACRIGADDDGSPNAYVNGYMSNVRVVKGTAVYTSNFTVPTTPLTAISGTSLLTCQSNRFRDASANNFTLTANGDVKVSNFSAFNPTAPYSAATNGGSGYFDGSGDYLQTPSNSAFALGTGDYTVECWIYATSTPSDMGIYEGRSTGAATDGFTLTAFSGSVIRIYCGSALISSSSTSYVNQWVHVAVTRASGTTTLWINGISQGTSSASYNCTNTDAVIGAGRYSSGSSVNAFFPGYISNFRIVKGTAVYTSAFTPPTAPLTAVSGTSLLLSMTNSGIYDQTANNDMETVGNAQVSTVQSKFGGSSVYFDGSGDSGRIAVDQPALQFGTGNFTAEGWIYSTGGTGTYQHVLTGGTSWTSGSGGIYWYYNGGSPTLGAAWNQLPANPAVNSGTLSINTWYHFALVRNGNTMTLYINGTSVSTYSVTGYSLAFNNQSRTNIGGGGWDNDFAGYIDDLRVTKGVARYTSNFTPPSGPFGTY